MRSSAYLCEKHITFVCVAISSTADYQEVAIFAATITAAALTGPRRRCRCGPAATTNITTACLADILANITISTTAPPSAFPTSSLSTNMILSGCKVDQEGDNAAL
jgi:hypothetical protein